MDAGPPPWPLAVELMGLMGQGDVPKAMKQDLPDSATERSKESGHEDQAAQVGYVQPHSLPRPQMQAEKHLGRLVGKFLQAGQEAGPVELFYRKH